MQFVSLWAKGLNFQRDFRGELSHYGSVWQISRTTKRLSSAIALTHNAKQLHPGKFARAAAVATRTRFAQIDERLDQEQFQIKPVIPRAVQQTQRATFDEQMLPSCTTTTERSVTSLSGQELDIGVRCVINRDRLRLILPSTGAAAVHRIYDKFSASLSAKHRKKLSDGIFQCKCVGSVGHMSDTCYDCTTPLHERTSTRTHHYMYALSYIHTITRTPRFLRWAIRTLTSYALNVCYKNAHFEGCWFQGRSKLGRTFAKKRRKLAICFFDKEATVRGKLAKLGELSTHDSHGSIGFQNRSHHAHWLGKDMCPHVIRVTLAAANTASIEGCVCVLVYFWVATTTTAYAGQGNWIGGATAACAWPDRYQLNSQDTWHPTSRSFKEEPQFDIKPLVNCLSQTSDEQGFTENSFTNVKTNLAWAKNSF